jgi:4'-phosphopantetheinyl transferase EntD
VAAEEAFTDPPDVKLFPEEEAVIAKAAGKRRREFTTARACARAALARLGLPPAAILPGLRGAPQWPARVVGSMTHCAGYRACAVAHDRDVLTIGLDAEPHDALPDGVLGAVASGDEQARLAALAIAAPGVSWDRVLFSAKESVYKAWFPLTRERHVHRTAARRRARSERSGTHRFRGPLAGRRRPDYHRDRGSRLTATPQPQHRVIGERPLGRQITESRGRCQLGRGRMRTR